MKRKPLAFVVAFLTALPHLRGGDLSIVGNVNVASNLMAKTIGIGSDSTFSLSRYDTCGEGIALRRSGAESFVAMTLLDGTDMAVISCYRTNEYCYGRPLAINPDGGGVTVFGCNTADGVFTVCGDGHFSGDVGIEGKLTLYAGMDPPYLLLDSETRAGIANRVAREVPPSKRTGAALFWNAQTKQLEIYVASEGVFYNLAGKTLAAINPPKVASAKVTTTYRIDKATGAIVPQETLQTPSWQVKRGYQFNRLTGEFTKTGGTNAVPVAVTAQEAL